MASVRKVSGALALLFLLSALTGCSPTAPGKPSLTPTSESGTLARIEYSYASGTMAYTGFGIDVEPSRIVSAEYWPHEDWEASEMTEIADVAITPEQWQELDAAVRDILEKLEPIRFTKETSLAEDLGLEILDGGDKFTFALTWEKDGAQARVEYYSPRDRRFQTLTTLLKEMAEPIGREIPRYEAPCVTGIYFWKKPLLWGQKYSYQCTPVDSADPTGEYYLFAYYDENGAERSCTGRVDAQVWKDIATVCEGLNVEALPERSSRKETGTSLTLCYSDGTQIAFQPDKDTRKALQTFFAALVSSQQK